MSTGIQHASVRIAYDTRRGVITGSCIKSVYLMKNSNNTYLKDNGSFITYS